MPHLFTPEEANKMIPEVRKTVSDIVALKKELDETSQSEHSSLLDRLTLLASELAEHGIELKDANIGLVDFPAKRFEENVYLCWKLGEPQVLYWHGLLEGYQGRKPLKPATL